MALLTWSEKLSVQVKKFDDQHKKLIDLVNQLHDAMKVGKGRDVLGGVLQSLVEYTGTHFAAEEQMMRANNYPGYEAHKKEHNQLVIQVHEIQRQLKDGAMLSQQVMNFLKKWLEDHILGCDKEYGPFFKQKGLN